MKSYNVDAVMSVEYTPQRILGAYNDRSGCRQWVVVDSEENELYMDEELSRIDHDFSAGDSSSKLASALSDDLTRAVDEDHGARRFEDMQADGNLGLVHQESNTMSILEQHSNRPRIAESDCKHVEHKGPLGMTIEGLGEEKKNGKIKEISGINRRPVKIED
jgi:hypothetical protein